MGALLGGHEETAPVLMRESLPQAGAFLNEVFAEWSKDDARSQFGAALAYYTIFSMAPLLVLVIAIAGLVFAATRPAVVGHPAAGNDRPCRREDDRGHDRARASRPRA